MSTALTQGQRRLLDNLCQGGSNKEVAARMGVSLSTLKTRSRLLYAKLTAQGVLLPTTRVKKTRACAWYTNERLNGR